LDWHPLKQIVADRVEKGDELERRARDDKKRRVGVPATSLDQQGDGTAQQAIQTAVEACGRGAVTVHCPGRLENEPRPAVFMVDVNEVEEKAAHGGKIEPCEIRRLKTVVAVVGHTDVTDLAWVLKKLLISTKHENGHPGHMYDRVMITRDSETGLVATAVDQWKASNKESREQPTKKRRTHGRILSEQDTRH
jgi:hypothetical protein